MQRALRTRISRPQLEFPVPAALVLPADGRVVEALARLGMATVAVIGPASAKERLAMPLAAEEACVLAADVDALVALLAR